VERECVTQVKCGGTEREKEGWKGGKVEEWKGRRVERRVDGWKQEPVVLVRWRMSITRKKKRKRNGYLNK